MPKSFDIVFDGLDCSINHENHITRRSWIIFYVSRGAAREYLRKARSYERWSPRWLYEAMVTFLAVAVGEDVLTEFGGDADTEIPGFWNDFGDYKLHK